VGMYPFSINLIFAKKRSIIMEMTDRMPANYNVLSENEMTYTTSGAWTDWYAGLNVAGDVVGAVMTGVMIVNWLDMLGGARNWVAANKTNDLVTNLENGVKAWVDYTSASAWNAVRSIAATITAVGGTVLIGGIGIPYGLIGTAAALLTA